MRDPHLIAAHDMILRPVHWGHEVLGPCFNPVSVDISRVAVGVSFLNLAIKLRIVGSVHPKFI